MAQITSRQGLIEYGLMMLGYPVTEVNIEDTQLEINIDNALQFYREYHFDAVERTYLKRQVTANEITISGVTGTFLKDEWVVSSSTGSRFQIYSVHDGLLRSVAIVNGNLQVAEVLTGELSGATATVDVVVIGDMQNKYIPLPENVHSVNKVLNFSQATSQMSMFDLQYQWRLNDIYSITNSSMVYYTQMRQHLQLISDTLINQPQIRFNRHTNRVYIDTNFDRLRPDDFLVLECYAILDENVYTDMFNDRMLKKLVVAYFKRQWGQNLSKYDQILLPGGVRLRGGELYSEAIREIAEIEDTFQSNYEIPPAMLVG